MPFDRRSSALICGHSSLRWSELRISRCSRERNHIPDVFHPGEIHHHSFEAHAETGVLHAPKAAQVEIPPVILFLHARLFANPAEHTVGALFTLAPPLC